MPETVSGQTRSPSATRRLEQTLPQDERTVMLGILSTAHVILFVRETALASAPWVGLEDELTTEAGAPI